jgi:hypothetical protein
MKKQILISVLLILCSISTYSQCPFAISTTANNGSVYVYSNGANIFVRNTDANNSYMYSFSYEITNYSISYPKWSRGGTIPCYSEVSKTNNNANNLTVEANTTEKTISIGWTASNSSSIKITGVYNVQVISSNNSTTNNNTNNESTNENNKANTKMDFPKASSVTSGCITAFTQQGYIVKATNTCNYACSFSINYVLYGYDQNDNLVSTTEKTYTNATTYANKEADGLFTTPQDPDKKITYWIEVTGVYDVKKYN